MQKTTLTGVTISEVKRTHGFLMYLWPFQSRRELLSTLFLLAVGNAIMTPIGYLLVGSGGLLQALICGIFSGLAIVYTVLPARITMATSGEARHALTDLRALLAKFGYVASEQPLMPGRCHYRSKRSRFWRWDEQDIELLVREHELVLNGPVLVLQVLRANLLPKDDHAYLKT